MAYLVGQLVGAFLIYLILTRLIFWFSRKWSSSAIWIVDVHIITALLLIVANGYGDANGGNPKFLEQIPLVLPIFALVLSFDLVSHLKSRHKIIQQANTAKNASGTMPKSVTKRHTILQADTPKSTQGATPKSAEERVRQTTRRVGIVLSVLGIFVFLIGVVAGNPWAAVGLLMVVGGYPIARAIGWIIIGALP